MEKWVLQVMNAGNWELVLHILDNGMDKFDLRVVAMGPAVVPLFAPGKVRSAIESYIGKGLKLEICSGGMKMAGLMDAIPPVGASTRFGLTALSASLKEGYAYFVVT
jgi:intracellular sulfur oxidation DsrE/DsrF family protein